MKQIYTPAKDYKVLVRCFTYNQSMYIEDALNGFAMQKTDFPFVCLVMDDASTDGEQEVIKAWMERECDMERAENVEIEKSFIILVPHKANSSCTFAFYFLKENLYKKGGKMSMVTPWREHCEYEALCEGDDYWIHPDKLSRQAGFLDENPEYSMIFHANKKLKNTGEVLDVRRYPYDNSDCPIKDLIKVGGGYCATNSVMFKIELYGTGYQRWISSCPVGDLPMQLTLFCLGKVYYINEFMSVYRIASSSSWSQRMSKDKMFRIRTFWGILDIWKKFNIWTNNAYWFDIQRKIVKDYYYFIRNSIYIDIKHLFHNLLMKLIG